MKSFDQFYYVPILESLNSYLENEIVLKLVTQKPSNNPNYIADYCDGELYKTCPLFQSDHSLAIILYYDDIETCNPLGSKSRKLSCFYYSLANMPKRYRSKLSNIRLAAICERHVLDKYGIDRILEPLITDLKKLQNGYTFTIRDRKITFFGGLYLVLGDTPASNLMGGFKEGVGFARQKCRMCYCTNELMQIHFQEELFNARTHQDYVRQSNELEASTTKEMKVYLSTASGINRQSSLISLPNFDITKSLPQDIMHVIFEGLAQFEIKEVIKYFINNGYFTVNELNSKFANFDYGYFDMTDKPSSINAATINSEDNRVRQNASQMKLISKVILFILSKLQVDEGNDIFQFTVSLVEIVKVLMSPVLSLGTVSCLKDMIEEHLKSFLFHFPDCRIVPKQHFLIHIPSCIKKHGPCSGYSCLRFEGKNKIPKGIVKTKNNFINVPKMAANEMVSVEALEGNNVDSDCLVNMFSTDYIPGTISDISDDLREYILQKLQSFYQIRDDRFLISECSHVTYHGVKYISDMAFVAAGTSDGILPDFGKVVRIFIINTNEIFFELQMIETRCFDKDLQSYSVDEPIRPEGTVLCRVGDLLDYHVFNTVDHDGSLFVPTDFDFTDIISRKFEQMNTKE